MSKKFLHSYNRLLSLTNLHTRDYRDSTAELKRSMKRMKAFLKRLGSPHTKLNFIHVAGTSGKGSAANMTHQILARSGEEVAAYLSPHTTSYLERFHLNGRLMDPDELAAHMEAVIETYRGFIHHHDTLSFFELSTALAMYAAKKSGVDWCVLEAGMGGRWDATNVIPRPVVAVITNINKDHTEVLGDSLAQIARAKAGIIKKDSVVLVGETRSGLRKLFKEVAVEKQAALFFVRPPHEDVVETPLGPFQQHNAALAARAAEEAGVQKKDINKALKHIQMLPCRFERMQKDPVIVLDGAHSPAKVKSLVEQIKVLDAPVRLVFGAVAKKDTKAMVELLKPHIKSLTATRFTTTFRKAANPARLLSLAPKRKRAGYFLDPREALQHAKKHAKGKDVIIVTGSLYLAGELREEWVSEGDILKRRSSFI